MSSRAISSLYRTSLRDPLNVTPRIARTAKTPKSLSSFAFSVSQFCTASTSRKSPATMSKHERSQSQDDVLRHPTPKRAKEIDAHSPFAELEQLLKKQKDDHKPRNVLHWFRSKDLRMQDNHALSLASKKSQEGSGALITAYLFAPADMEWHGTSPARVDFLLQSLQKLQDELKEKNIPLAIITAEQRAQKVDTVLQFAKEHNISHIYANMEYEVDELRRDIKMAKHTQEEQDTSFSVVHDQTVVRPLELRGGSGPHKVFTPYWKLWCSHVAQNPKLLDLYPDPEENDKSATEKLKQLFDAKIPSLPDSKQYVSTEDQKRIRSLWPAGHQVGHQRATKFLSRGVKKYKATRSNPGADTSSRLSPYFASGVLSVREALNIAAEHNSSGKDFSESAADDGIASWVREVVFREFYRHTLAMTPHDSMNLPHNLKFNNVKWVDNEEHWKAWCDGQTGMPLVDAGMRQLKAEAWMHNRARMNVSSYLSANLLLDYRRGERWFAENLVVSSPRAFVDHATRADH